MMAFLLAALFLDTATTTIGIHSTVIESWSVASSAAAWARRLLLNAPKWTGTHLETRRWSVCLQLANPKRLGTKQTRTLRKRLWLLLHLVADATAARAHW